jgi:predicted esterase
VQSATPRSQLTFLPVPAARQPVRATIIPLQGKELQQDDLVKLGRSLGSDIELFVPEAPRVTYFGRAFVSRYWFIGDPGFPEPASFGDTLYQVEQFVYDVVDRVENEDRLPFLLGCEQGAVLALAAAEFVPERLAGIMAVCGYLPDIAGWDPPATELNGLPILLVNEADEQTLPLDLLEATRERLVRKGATVETVTVEDAKTLGAEVEEVLATWLRTQSS